MSSNKRFPNLRTAAVAVSLAWLLLAALACAVEPAGRLSPGPPPAGGPAKVVYAGVRSSKYGIKPFPEPPAFFPNLVMFQIGYNSDKPWWSKLPDPPKTIGDAIRKMVKQDMAVIWVDFSLREVLPTGGKKQP